MSFATNDERTAKRVSDSLGTATEMRAMQNYAGHRLSPWLGHLMVSRSETARPLLTPGEVMQLPPDDELVMLAGVPPICARKVRYYEDARFRERVHRVPENLRAGYAPKPDDWSGLKPVAVRASAAVAARGGEAEPLAAPAVNGASKQDDDAANAGLRREPGLDPHKDIVPELPKLPGNELNSDLDEPDAGICR